MARQSLDRIRRVGLVGLLFVTAGCLAPTGTKVENSAAVAEQVESRYENVDGFQATMVRTLNRSTRSTVTRATVRFEKGESLRIAYQSGPRAGTVTVIDDPSPASVFGGTEAAATGAKADADAAEVYGALAGELVRSNEVVYAGADTLDGHRVARFTMTPSANSSDGVAQHNLTERQVWIDTERGVPLKVQSTMRASGATVTETIRFRNVTLTARSGSSGATGEAT